MLRSGVVPGDTAAMEAALVTLTEAAARTGYSRAALKQRVQRGRLPAIKGNDGVLRVRVADLDCLPPMSPQSPDDTETEALQHPALFLSVLDRLRDDAVSSGMILEQARKEAEEARGHVARLEERLTAAGQREGELRARLDRAEATIAELQRPWLARLWRGLAGR